MRTLPEIVFRGDEQDKAVSENYHERVEGEDMETKAPASETEKQSVEKNDLTTPLLEDSASSLPCHIIPSSLHENFDNTACSICLEEYCDGHRLRVLPCHHAFHSHCIGPWLTRRSPTCPLCKAEFEGAGGDDNITCSSDSSNVGNEVDEATASDGEEGTGARTVARMPEINPNTGTSREAPRRSGEVGPRYVRIRAPDMSDESDNGSSDSDSSAGSSVFGFWRFIFRRHRGRRDEEELASVEGRQQVEEVAAAETQVIGQQQVEYGEGMDGVDSANEGESEAEAEESAVEETQHGEEGGEREESNELCREEGHASASAVSACSTSDIECGRTRRSRELREPLLTEEERSASPPHDV